MNKLERHIHVLTNLTEVWYDIWEETFMKDDEKSNKAEEKIGEFSKTIAMIRNKLRWDNL